MGEIGEKKRVLDNSVAQRKIDQELKCNGVPKSFLIAVLWMIPCVLYVGVVLGSENPGFQSDFNESFEIDDYTFFFVSSDEDERMDGRYGYTYLDSQNIWINSDLVVERDWKQIKNTCQHEILHTIGVPSENHDFIDRYETQIDEPVCNELLERIKN